MQKLNYHIEKIVLYLLIFICFSHTNVFSQQTKFEKYYDYGFAESANCVRQTKDGGYILAGRQGITINVMNVMLIKTDSLGEVEWEKFYPHYQGYSNLCALNELLAKVRKFNVVNKMMVGPLVALYRQRHQTTPRC